MTPLQSLVAAGTKLWLDSVDLESPTPTGTITFTLSHLIHSSVQMVSTGVAQATLLTSDLPAALATYQLKISYSGDSNYSSDTITNACSITLQSPPSGAPADLAPNTTAASAITAPAGDGTAAGVGTSNDTGEVYATGSVDLVRTDLTSNGFGTAWGESWGWSNASGYADGLSGTGATQTHLPAM